MLLDPTSTPPEVVICPLLIVPIFVRFLEESITVVLFICNAPETKLRLPLVFSRISSVEVSTLNLKSFLLSIAAIPVLSLSCIVTAASVLSSLVFTFVPAELTWSVCDGAAVPMPTFLSPLTNKALPVFVCTSNKVYPLLSPASVRTFSKVPEDCAALSWWIKQTSSLAFGLWTWRK